MTDTLTIKQTAKLFWESFMIHETHIHETMLKRNADDYYQVNTIIEQITTKLKIQNMVGIQFGIDVRNGMNLIERKDHIEIIISPLFQKKNQELTIELYNASHNIKLPTHWSVIKYKFHNPTYINTIILNYKDQQDVNKLIEITKDSFLYHPIINEKKTQISVLLFIDDNVSKHLIKKEIYNEREIWIPKDNGIHAILDSVIGEYNLLNTMDKMEIHLKSDLGTDEFKDITTKKIENIVNDINMLNGHALSKHYICSRCEYSNKHVKLYTCKCHKARYCDITCQKAHRAMHLLSGCNRVI
jgi:hypothetical protein